MTMSKKNKPRNEEKRETVGGLFVLILGVVIIYFISVNLGS